jgi:hypothetical protein
MASLLAKKKGNQLYYYYYYYYYYYVVESARVDGKPRIEQTLLNKPWPKPSVWINCILPHVGNTVRRA